jgi:hypothetical protein
MAFRRVNVLPKLTTPGEDIVTITHPGELDQGFIPENNRNRPRLVATSHPRILAGPRQASVNRVNVRAVLCDSPGVR